MDNVTLNSRIIDRLWDRLPRPPLWVFKQYSPRPVVLPKASLANLTNPLLRFSIVTPAYNHGKYLKATIDSVLDQKYPALSYHVQDGGSKDGTAELLQCYKDLLSWRSEADKGQGSAINLGFAALGSNCDVMAYLNSDDILTPGTLSYVAQFFQANPDVDIVYGNRIIIDQDGQETGRAVMPRHDARALRFIGYVPQETMFWRRRVWEKVGPIDENFRFALDWDFMLRAQKAGFKMTRLPRFMGCFRVHLEQKTSAMMNVGLEEMEILRKRENGHGLQCFDICCSVLPFLAKQFAYHHLYRLNLLKY